MPGAFFRSVLGLVLSSACIAGCAGHGAETAARRSQEIPQQRIQIGMKEESIAQRLGPAYRIVGVKEYPDGVMEVRHYVVNRVNHLEDTASRKEYFFYFWKGELVRWDIPGEWEPEADRIHDATRRR